MLPEEFKKNMISLMGEDEYGLLEKSYLDENVRSLRLNPLKDHPVESADLVSLFKLEKMPDPLCGFYFGSSVFPGRSPFHDAGAYYIQDPGAMIPAALLIESCHFDAGRKMRILDLCASPGGKSTQIAAAMKGEGLLVCNEINRSRAEILSGNIERMGIVNAIVTNESPERLAGYFEGYFDAVIVDAPCSGEGMFRKDPGAVSEWSPENVSLCTERQKQILENAYIMLRPGGALVYSTCTFERGENEDMITSFVSEHPDMKPEDTSFLKNRIPGLKDGLSGLPDAVRVWPMYFRGEGQFASLLVKDGESEGGISLKGYELPSVIKDKKSLVSFLKDSLKDKTADRILASEKRFKLFGDNLYIMPDNAPNISGLKVLRNGLHLGTFKKDRFEPSHALALTLSEGDVRTFVRVGENKAEEYVHGMTLEGEGNGWCLVSAEGYSLGWGKASGGRIKNHYPKGLRVK